MDEDGYPASNEYGLTNVPTFYLIAPDGTVQVDSVGFGKKGPGENCPGIGALDGPSRCPALQAGRSGPRRQAGLTLEKLGSVRAFFIPGSRRGLLAFLVLRRLAAFIGNHARRPEELPAASRARRLASFAAVNFVFAFCAPSPVLAARVTLVSGRILTQLPCPGLSLPWLLPLPALPFLRRISHLAVLGFSRMA